MRIFIFVDARTSLLLSIHPVNTTGASGAKTVREA
jgi:hypothetical protein